MMMIIINCFVYRNQWRASAKAIQNQVRYWFTRRTSSNWCTPRASRWIWSDLRALFWGSWGDGIWASANRSLRSASRCFLSGPQGLSFQFCCWFFEWELLVLCFNLLRLDLLDLFLGFLFPESRRVYTPRLHNFSGKFSLFQLIQCCRKRLSRFTD